MAFITYPLNNIDYTAEDAELFHCTRTSGIWAEDSFPISVTSADNNVTIGTGIAWINNEEFSGKVAALKSAEVLDLGIADSTYPRIDVIAIQFNANNNATDVIIKKGTPATSPVRPSIVRTGAIYELYLASVYRPAGATAVTASNITDLRMDRTVCGLMADSVTSIDTSAINAQVEALIANLEAEIEIVKDTSGLMFQSEWVDNGAIPIPKGGTNATTAAEARQNINFIGANPIASIEDDTPANWIALGTGIAFISASGKLNNQPTPYGYVENYTDGNYIYQVIHSLNGASTAWSRSGTKAKWYNKSANWVKQLDETNGIQIKKLWENASPTSSFAAQTISLDLSGYKFIICKFKNYTAGDRYYTGLFVVDGTTQRYSQYYNYSSNGYSQDAYRELTVKTTGVVFTIGYMKGVLSLEESNGIYMLPVEIYGIKGVQ